MCLFANTTNRKELEISRPPRKERLFSQAQVDNNA